MGLRQCGFIRLHDRGAKSSVCRVVSKSAVLRIPEIVKPAEVMDEPNDLPRMTNDMGWRTKRNDTLKMRFELNHSKDCHLTKNFIGIVAKWKEYFFDKMAARDKLIEEPVNNKSITAVH